MSFYVTLISDSSKHFFPDNKISQFTTQLPTAIHLTGGEWEVGLADLIYTHTWYNVRKDNNLFGFSIDEGPLEGRRVPAGYYQTVPDLLKAMTLTSHKNKIQFSYHDITKRVTLKTQGKSKVVLYNGISELLGFNPGEYVGNVQSPYVADTNASLSVMYVYCDLVEPQIVGDVQAPLLKIVTVKGQDGEIINEHYARPFYQPVIRKHFQTIQIDMRMHSGELVPFERGKVFAVLHFRMRQLV